jgi:hypothetical protein
MKHTIAPMLSRGIVPHAPAGSLAPVLLPPLNIAHPHNHPTSPAPTLTLRLTLRQHHTEHTERTPAPQDSARPPLRNPLPHLRHHLHDSGQLRSHNPHLHDSEQPRSHNPHIKHRPARSPPPARLPQLTPAQLHLAHHLSHQQHPRPRQCLRPHFPPSLQCLHRPSLVYPFIL